MQMYEIPIYITNFVRTLLSAYIIIKLVNTEEGFLLAYYKETIDNGDTGILAPG